MNKLQFSLGSYSTCPDCGGSMICTAYADECTKCDYYVSYE